LRGLSGALNATGVELAWRHALLVRDACKSSLSGVVSRCCGLGMWAAMARSGEGRTVMAFVVVSGG